MRRWIWSSLVQFDALLSAEIGLPSMVKESLCDTVEPLNLLDEDFDESMSALPTPRLDAFHTPVQFLLVKTRFARIYCQISELADYNRQHMPKLYGLTMFSTISIHPFHKDCRC
jgi:hypothetical protein